MNACLPNPEEFHEPLPSLKLISYLHGQFLDAVQKEESEGGRGHEAPNGTFIQRVPTDAEDRHVLLRGSRRIVLKPPHPSDIPGFHCAVYAVRLDEDSRNLPNREYLEAVDFYVVRDYSSGRGGPHMLLNADGAHNADVDPGGGLIGVGGVTPEGGVISALETSEQMLAKYSGYNIVAVTD